MAISRTVSVTLMYYFQSKWILNSTATLRFSLEITDLARLLKNLVKPEAKRKVVPNLKNSPKLLGI